MKFFSETDLVQDENIILENFVGIVTNKRVILADGTTIFLKNISAIQEIKEGLGLLAIILLVGALCCFVLSSGYGMDIIGACGIALLIVGIIIGYKHYKNGVYIYSSGFEIEIKTQGYADYDTLKEFIECVKKTTAQIQ